MFLSDRFIKGTCPKCKSEDQYGDSCEVCGTTYNATELLNPRSTLSGATPIEKSSDHYFFKLPNFAEYLQNGPAMKVAYLFQLLTNWMNGLKQV